MTPAALFRTISAFGLWQHRFTKNVSFPSPEIASEHTMTLIVLLCSPAVQVIVPAVWMKSTPGRQAAPPVAVPLDVEKLTVTGAPAGASSETVKVITAVPLLGSLTLASKIVILQLWGSAGPPHDFSYCWLAALPLRT